MSMVIHRIFSLVFRAVLLLMGLVFFVSLLIAASGLLASLILPDLLCSSAAKTAALRFTPARIICGRPCRRKR